jgi:NAD(P)H-dependent FMN reductase
MDTITIAVICGTKRVGRQSVKAAEWVAAAGRNRPGLEIIFVDPKDFNLPPDGAPEDGSDPKYTEITERADAFFIVTPEYNNSFPSSLKRLLDSEYLNYKRKPVALAGASDGPWGGVRACDALLPVCHALGLVNIQPKLYFPKVDKLFNEDGTMQPDKVETYTKAVQNCYTELEWYARALKAARSEKA